MMLGGEEGEEDGIATKLLNLYCHVLRMRMIQGKCMVGRV